MPMPQNHVIDPTFFYDAIEMFSFDYDCYVISETTLDEIGRRVNSFTHTVIRGSLQTQGVNLQQNMAGNTQELKYNFYCKSLYRINIGDFIKYKNRWLHVENVLDYDEWGVRSAELKMINLTNYHDFEEYLNYINGVSIV